MIDDARAPWHHLYGSHPPQMSLPHATGLQMARAALARAGDRPLLHYFDTPLSGAALDRASDALAHVFATAGLVPGDRVALQLQNVPHFPIATIAAWKAGLAVVPVNPMLRERELAPLLADSGARALITHEDLFETVGGATIAGTDVVLAITASPLDFLTGPRPAPLADVRRRVPEGAQDFAELLAAHDGEAPPDVAVGPDDVAVLFYTSGTTGPSKGAMNLHRNVVYTSSMLGEWAGLGPDDVLMGLAPLFHVTGFVIHLGTALATGAPLVLAHRFDPGESLRLIERHRATCSVAAITAYTAMMNDPAFAQSDVSSLRAAYSGGAPVPPAILEAWRAATGTYLHNAYGLTETTAACTLVPQGTDAPVDPKSGALSIGVPVYGTTIEVLDEQGAPAPVGEAGELVVDGPGVVPGYWNNPDESAHALPDGRLRTGDIGFMDADGWFYIVDRRKDLIVVSGYKVWPRDVEDVLYQHPAVREAAVVGVPHEYQGEAVKAFVSLRPGAAATPDELIAFCRERMAAYRYPRAVEVLDELPKTASGKILRRALR
ncbi:MAG: AMP-dependent Acyl-CoA synthetase and ligase [Conexibacter sp.]|nr:AMP-dependent Acyl-CoA synthetase and ligase [Conexibacter sp.]